MSYTLIDNDYICPKERVLVIVSSRGENLFDKDIENLRSGVSRDQLDTALSQMLNILERKIDGDLFNASQFKMLTSIDQIYEVKHSSKNLHLRMYVAYLPNTQQWVILKLSKKNQQHNDIKELKRFKHQYIDQFDEYDHE